MNTYQHYAHVYEESGQLAFSERMIGYLASLLDEFPAPGRSLVDLACGTGTVAVALAEQGWHVTGVDLSETMLAEARVKQPVDSRAVTWMRQDMRAFGVEESVSVVTCLYDSLNYMLEADDLAQVFHRVHTALQDGGLFLFDMNTLAAFELFWSGQTYFDETLDLSLVMASHLDRHRARVTVDVTWFERDQETSLYSRHYERHVEQAYPPEHICTLLGDVGFQVLAMRACFGQDAPHDETPRIMWVARKGECHV